MTSAAYIVSKISPAKLRLPVGLSLVNKIAVPFQFAMSIIEHELVRTGKSENFYGAVFTYNH